MRNVTMSLAQLCDPSGSHTGSPMVAERLKPVSASTSEPSRALHKVFYKLTDVFIVTDVALRKSPVLWHVVRVPCMVRVYCSIEMPLDANMFLNSFGAVRYSYYRVDLHLNERAVKTVVFGSILALPLVYWVNIGAGRGPLNGPHVESSVSYSH